MAKASEARCLLDHDGHKINSVLSGRDAERAVEEGWGDPDPAAVKFAKSLEQAGDEPAAEEVHEPAGGDE